MIFYHRHQGLALILCGLVALVQPVAAAKPKAKPEATRPAPDVLADVPPRTIADITRLLEQYKPDSAFIASATAAADAAPAADAAREAQFDFYLQRGRAANRIGRVSQQISDLRKAVELGQPGSAGRVRALRELATAEMQGGNYLNARRALETALAEATTKESRGQGLGIYQSLIHANTSLGDFAAARQYLREAEARYQRMKAAESWAQYGHNWTAMIYRARGEMAQAEGRLGEAEQAFRAAVRANAEYILVAREENGKGSSEENALAFQDILERYVANTLLMQGRLIEAEVLARKILRSSLQRRGLNSVEAARIVSLLATIVAEQGRYAEATVLARASVDAYVAAGTAPESIVMARARRTLAGALVAQKKYAEAIREFEAQRRGLLLDKDQLRRTGSSAIEWVLALLRTGEQGKAETMAKSIYDFYQERFGKQSPRTAEAHAFYAMALAARGAYPEANKEFGFAVPILVEKALEAADNETGSLRRQQRLLAVLEAYMQSLSEDASLSPAARMGETFRLADVARGSAVQRALTASAARATLGDPQLAELARREQDLQQRIATLVDLHRELLSAPPEQQLPNVQTQLQADVEQLKRERTDLKRNIESRYPEYAALLEPKPATLRQAQSLLRPDEALLAWYFGEEASWVWAIPANGEPAFKMIPLRRAEMAASVASLRKALAPDSVDRIPPFDLAGAHRLYTQLLQPVEAAWKDAKALLAIPHAELGQLPLAVLPTAPTAAAAYREAPWLVRQVAVSQLPSVTALASLRRLPAADAQRRPFIGFGDPLFNSKQVKMASADGVQTRSAKSPRLRSAPNTAAANSADITMLPRLPETSEEIREIARILKADLERDVYLQSRATEQTVLSVDLSRHRIVMFATHGLVPGELNGLSQPALALTAPSVSGNPGDGLLTMDEVLGLKLNADWVVLSACNTAAGQEEGAEAVSGLGRAFFYSGARALLVSNWPVETLSARALMTDLFRRQSEQASLSKAEALRLSMLAVMEGAAIKGSGSSYAHPLFWAPFVVVGD